MNEIGHGRLAILRDLHTVMSKHAVACIITCLEINKCITHKDMLQVHIAVHELVIACIIL